MLATDGLKAEIKKWDNKHPSKAGDLMQLQNHRRGCPISINEPVS
jgi:hypothetical protein